MITIEKAKKVSGSRVVAYNVSVDGKPFGRVWRHATTKTCVDTWKVGFADSRPALGGFTTKEDAINAILKNNP